MSANCLSFLCFVFVNVVKLPRVTSQLKEIQGELVKFTIQAIGTKPLSYQWQWKPMWQPAWQQCPAESCVGATLTIFSVEKSNEGSYCCVVSNCSGTQTSNPAELSVGKKSTINFSTSYPCILFLFL